MKRRLRVVVPLIVSGALIFAPQAGADPSVEPAPPLPSPVDLMMTQVNDFTVAVQQQFQQLLPSPTFGTPVAHEDLPAPENQADGEHLASQQLTHPTATPGIRDTAGTVDPAATQTTDGGGTDATTVATTPLGKGIVKTVGKGIVKTPAPVVQPVPETQPAPETSVPETTGKTQQDPYQKEAVITVPRRSDGPNYHWKTDPVSMLMAAHVGPVLHRLDSSWFHAPDIPEESYLAESEGKSLFGPSTPLFIGENSLCTLGVAGYDKEGNMVGITAGHCGKPGDEVYSADSWPIGVAGYVVRSSKKSDYSLIRFDSDIAKVTRSYNGVVIDSIGGPAPKDFDMVCKDGVATGHSCGPQWTADSRISLSQVCAMQGDSGAPLRVGNRLVGIVSGGVMPNQNLACRTPWQGVMFQPTVSRTISSILLDLDNRGGYGAGFMLPTPTGSMPQAR